MSLEFAPAEPFVGAAGWPIADMPLLAQAPPGGGSGGTRAQSKGPTVTVPSKGLAP